MISKMYRSPFVRLPSVGVRNFFIFGYIPLSYDAWTNRTLLCLEHASHAVGRPFICVVSVYEQLLVFFISTIDSTKIHWFQLIHVYLTKTAVQNCAKYIFFKIYTHILSLHWKTKRSASYRLILFSNSFSVMTSPG